MEKGFVLIPVGHGRHAIVDWEDASLSQYRWRVRKCRTNVYVERTGGPSMHRTISQPAPGQITDHIDGNGLNNRRSNLRNVSPSENLRNVAGASRNSQSGVLGVTWHKGSRRWAARIFFEGRNVFLGKYRTVEEAAAARLAAEADLWGVQPRRSQAHEALATFETG